ncbi:MAG: adenylosuccinate lyase, partial [Bdellovibrionales bacterium]|nr:adenylosuccinate lyase [Bdellovibrionales bacterium]
MTALWSDEARFSLWLEVELAAMEAMVELGMVPASAYDNVRKNAKFDAERINEIEAKVKHDVIAFLTNVAEHAGEDARFLHLGMTSSDLLDTAFALQLCRATDLILKQLEMLLAAAKEQAFRHRTTVCIGRSHGIHAEPTTFGLKAAGWYAELQRGKKRIEAARQDVAMGAISGPVGTFAHLSPKVEELVCKKLGLTPAPVSTQIIARDSHAALFSAFALLATTIERIAVEVRHLQRTEVREAEEFFSKGQKGSSAMPHKRNPVLTENLTGLARMVRAYALPAMENVALWHERDISHSSVERMIGPDATITLDFALARLTGVVDKLLIYPERMQKNLDALGGLVHSQRVLLALVEAGVSREDAYRLVQRNAMPVWRGEGD